MQDALKCLTTERLGDPLEEQLWKNKAYMESRKLYHDQKERLKEKLSSSKEGIQLLLDMDDSVSLYSGRYGEMAYILGFHDGLEIGLKHGREYGKDSILSKDIPKEQTAD